jgi:archaellum component FlaC
MTSGTDSGESSKVFISYKREEKALADAVRTKLSELGVEYFMDDGLQPDGHYSVKLDHQLSTAAAVLVLWTRMSAKSDFVYAEAQKGSARGVLVAVLLDGISFNELRVPFNTYQASDLSLWRKKMPASDPHWQVVLGAIGDKLGRPGLPALALALDGSEVGTKQAFIDTYPTDPMVPRLQKELAARSVFQENFRHLEERVEGWRKNIDRRLKSVKKDFETRIGKLRRGTEPFTPPNLDAALDHDAEALQERLQRFQLAAEEAEASVLRADNAARAATEQAALVQKALSDLHLKYQDSQSEAEASKKTYSELYIQYENAQSEARQLSQKCDELQGRFQASESKVESLSRQVDETGRLIELKNHELTELQSNQQALQAGVEALQERIEKFRVASEEAQASVLRAESAAEAAADQAADVQKALSDLQLKYQDSQSEAQLLSQKWNELQNQYQASQSKVEALSRQVDETNRVVEFKNHELTELQSSQQALQARVPQIARRYGRRGIAAAAFGLLIGFGIGWFLLPGPSGEFGPQIAEWKAQLSKAKGEVELKNGELVRKQDEIRTLVSQRDELVRGHQTQLGQSQAETRKAQDAASSLTRQLSESRNEIRKAQGDLAQALESSNAQKIQSGNQLTQSREETARVRAELQTAQSYNAGLATQVRQAQAEIDRLKGVASATPVVRCDDASAYPYDPDRPATSKSKDRVMDLNLADAYAACEEASRSANLDQKTKRRMKLQLGRIIATRGMLELTSDQRNLLREQAGDLWKEAASLGSGQAHYLLGQFYAVAKDYKNSWKHYEESAALGNPTGLATAAYVLLFPDLYNTYKPHLPKEDQAQVQGLKYLNDALKTASPRAIYVRGRAILEGRANFTPDQKGLLEINFAFCKHDEEAARFYARPPKRTPLECTDSRVLASGR